MNYTPLGVSGLDIVKLTVCDAKGKVICIATFKDQNFYLDAYTYEVHTFKFAAADVSSYEVDLSNVYIYSVYDF